MSTRLCRISTTIFRKIILMSLMENLMRTRLSLMSSTGNGHGDSALHPGRWRVAGSVLFLERLQPRTGFLYGGHLLRTFHALPLADFIFRPSAAYTEIALQLTE